MTWSLACYTADGTQGLGVLREDGTLTAPTELKRWPSTMDLLEDWPAAQAVLRDLNPAEAPVIDYDALLPPLQWPRKVICAGVNYRRHMREMGGEIPESGWRPFFFLKAPTTSVIGPRDPIVISSAGRARYDWEAELAVVIGIKGKNIDAERAGFHAAAYCVCNDITARGYHKRERLRLWVNGELQQDESTADMVCSVAELIAAASEIVTLEPGDVIATGTPSGVGAGRGLYLRDGDVVRVTIDGLGTLENTVKENT